MDRHFFLLEEGKNIESRLHRKSLNENWHWMARVVGGPTLLGTGFLVTFIDLCMQVSTTTFATWCLHPKEIASLLNSWTKR